MKYLLGWSFFYFAILASCVGAADSTADPIIFKVNTLRLDVDNNTTAPLPDAELAEIKPIGRGSATDLECEGISNEMGEIICVVNQCNKTSPLSNTYHIAIHAPNEFGEMTPAKVKVFQCDVIPTPASAMFIEKTLIARKFIQDAQYVFAGNTKDVLSGQAAVSVEQYTDKMSSLLNKPAGTYSAIKIRRIFQDNSFTAVKSNESSKANDYSALAIAHANVWLNEWAKQNGIDDIETNELDKMNTLDKNINKLLEQSNSNKSLLVHQEQLKFLKESIEKGQLANEQFEVLESISIR
ncbi:hypothetical protein [Aliikangiella sp. G2MR2-5]|uniref:hypothetical protein n=1 Tax=Aliikangiella sp. G2MR2-5 TaxID=2788943 RepID=UPI0018ABCF0F|nr:hypothetical protein [Aliikangiella sp. G2MR2-5]